MAAVFVLWTADSDRAVTDNALMQTYKRLPVAFERGAGAWLYDSSERAYLDALAGIAVCVLGHSHPAVTRAITAQAGRLIHTSNIYEIPAQTRLAERLCAVSGLDRVFFGNSGAEANEAAIKLARLHGHHRDIEKPAIVVMEGAFHGRTLATLTATGNRRVQAGFEPLVSGFVRCPWNDPEALEHIARNNTSVAAVLLEPIQGEGGIRIPDPGYLAEVRRICDAHGWLMMLDEIQTGNGRTGEFFACQGAGVKPDVISVAKGLGNGIPIGACIAGGAAADLFQPGNHGSTFGGNPLSCTVGLAVLDVIEQEGLPAHAAVIGQRIVSGLRDATGDLECVRDVRGAGLMIGVELDRPCGALVEAALQRGLLINVTAESVIRLLPPLILTEDEADTIVERLTAAIREFAGHTG